MSQKYITEDIYHVPQVVALEIRLDRVDILKQDVDLDDTVVWLQVLDLPSLEMLPYQRDRAETVSVESLDSVADSSVMESVLQQPVKMTKKSSQLIAGEPQLNRSDTDPQVKPEVPRKPSSRKMSGPKKKEVRRSRNSVSAIKRKTSSKQLSVDHVKGLELGKTVSTNRMKSNSKTLSFKLEKKIDSADGSASRLDDAKDKVKDSDQESTIHKEEMSQKRIKLLSRLLAFPLEDRPEGSLYNSDCCILLPCSSVSDILYKMERMPILIYLVKLNPYKKVIGKVTIRFDYCFQNTIVKAAKVQGAVVSHTIQDLFLIYDPNDSKNVKIGWIQGSIKIISFGRYGITELKSPTGDLMVGHLREYRNTAKDSSKALEVVAAEEDMTNPYGFRPTVTRDTLPPSKGFKCPTKWHVESMFQHVQTYYKPKNEETCPTSCSASPKKPF